MLKERTKYLSSAFTAAQKEHFIATLEAEGCSRSTAWARLFRDGFVPWQMRGILNIIQDYSQQIGSPVPRNPRTFYKTLPSCVDFFKYMEDRGMGLNTVRFRFKEWNFKPWELKGVEQILNLPEPCQDPQE